MNLECMRWDNKMNNGFGGDQSKLNEIVHEIVEKWTTFEIMEQGSINEKLLSFSENCNEIFGSFWRLNLNEM